MKTLKKIMLTSLMIGSIVTIGLFTQGETSNNGVKNVNFTNENPYISAGSDVSICDGSQVMLQGVNTYTGGNTIWKTSGDGTFSNIYSLSAIYTPGPHDINKGSVVISLFYLPVAYKTALAYKTSNQQIHDSMVITFGNCTNTGNEPLM